MTICIGGPLDGKDVDHKTTRLYVPIEDARRPGLYAEVEYVMHKWAYVFGQGEFTYFYIFKGMSFDAAADRVRALGLHRPPRLV